MQDCGVMKNLVPHPNLERPAKRVGAHAIFNSATSLAADLLASFTELQEYDNLIFKTFF